MARVPITVYKKSALATVLSILGVIMFIVAIRFLYAGEWSGVIVFFPVGLLFTFLAAYTNDVKMFSLWLKAVREKGLEQQIIESAQVAVSAYNACPSKRTLKYIRGLNPQHADYIQSLLDAQKKKK